MTATGLASRAAIEADVLNSLASGVAVVNCFNQLVYCNSALALWLDVPPELYLGRQVEELDEAIQNRFLAADDRPVRLRFEDCDGISREFQVSSGNRTFYLRQDSTPWRDIHGNVQGRVFAFHDLSREKAIDRMKTEFISVASHELRTPMTSIKGSIDLVLGNFAGPITSETRELLEIAHKSCDRLIRLINDILDLAKIEAGQIKLNKVPLDLSDPVERSIRAIKSFADQAGVKISFLRPQTAAPVAADKDRIEQVVTNLLSNAVKFSPEHGEITVEVSVHPDCIRCTVSDRGCGIAEQDLAKVFGKFQQVGESSRKGGTGLGLAIAQRLVVEHGGKIWVESRVNQGSRFIFTIPAFLTTKDTKDHEG